MRKIEMVFYILILIMHLMQFHAFRWFQSLD